MVDFSARIDELMEYLTAEYALGSADRPAVEVLLGILLDVPDCPSAPRVMIDADWLSRDCTTAWFAFGGKIIPHSLGSIGSVRLRIARRTVAEWEAEAVSGIPVAVVEPEWRKPRHWPRSTSGTGEGIGNKFSEYLRVRARTPKSLSVLTVDRQAADRRTGMLRHLVDSAVSSSLRRAQAPKLAVIPEFAYYCEIAGKLCRPGTGMWEWMVGAIAQTAVRSAYLYNRASVGAADWSLAGKALGWQCAPWTQGLIERISVRGPMTRKATMQRRWKEYCQADMENSLRAAGNWAGAGGLDNAWEVRIELRRLAGLGVIKDSSGNGWVAGDEPDWSNTVRLVAGRAFD